MSSSEYSDAKCCGCYHEHYNLKKMFTKVTENPKHKVWKFSGQKKVSTFRKRRFVYFLVSYVNILFYGATSLRSSRSSNASVGANKWRLKIHRGWGNYTYVAKREIVIFFKDYTEVVKKFLGRNKRTGGTKTLPPGGRIVVRCISKCEILQFK